MSAASRRTHKGDVMATVFEWIGVDSSNLESVGYVKTTRTMYIRFRSGKIYSYHDVEEVVFNELVGAESVGKFFNEFIRGGGYEYTQL